MKGQGEGGKEGSIYDRNSNKGDEKLESGREAGRREKGRRAWYREKRQGRSETEK